MRVVLRIRLALHGCRNRPFYHIVVAHNIAKRDGRHLEQVSGRLSGLVQVVERHHVSVVMGLNLFPPLQVGCYDPMPNYNKEIVVGLNIDRIK